MAARNRAAPARAAAFETLAQVERGGYAADLLLERCAGMASRDAGLAEEIVMGVLRRRGQLDYLIQHYSGKDPLRMDLEVALALRMGIYQLRYLDRVPPHAAVNESVELARAAGKGAAAGLVNAVLRKVDRAEVEFPDRATRLSMPRWLLHRWDRQFGTELAEIMANAFLEPPLRYVRVPEGAAPPAPQKAVETGIPGCYRWLEGFPEGYRIMDAGSQSIVPLLEVRPEHWVLDLCAAPGNKTLQILETCPRVVAGDRVWKRVRQMRDSGAWLTVLNGEAELPFGRVFDRVLVDAPCTGTGTIGRNPEIKWRLTPAEVTKQQQRQVKILRNAMKVAKPGGSVVYSTCSLEREENEGVVEQVNPTALQETRMRLPGRDEGDGFFAAVLPST